MLKAHFRNEVVKLLGIQDKDILSVEQEKGCYATAFHLYEQRSYRKSAHLFTSLVLTNPFSSLYWQGLASAKQMAREYEAALHGWSLMALLDPHNPLPHFQAAECLLAINEKEEAKKALESALKLNPGPALETKIQTLIHYVIR